MTSAELSILVERVPEGWTLVEYDGRRWGLTRTTRAHGGGVALYAEQLGGPDVVSANVYRTSTGHLLKPCEMPADVVLAFLRGWRRAQWSRDHTSHGCFTPPMGCMPREA